MKAIFDRKNEVERKGRGVVEVKVYISRTVSKHITVGTISPKQWPAYEHDPKVRKEVVKCEYILNQMELQRRPFTKEVFEKLYENSANEEKKHSTQSSSYRNSFLDFFFDELGHEKIAPRTRQARMVVYNTLLRFDRIHTFDDLTPAPRRPQNLSDGDDIESLQCRKSSMM